MTTETSAPARANLRRLLSLVWPYRLTLFAGLLALLIGTGMTLLYPRLIGTCLLYTSDAADE